MTTLTFRLISHYDSGWLEHNVDEPAPLTRVMTAYSAVKPDDMEETEEWAEEVMLQETADWIQDFFVNAALAAEPARTLEEFIDMWGWGDMHFRYLKIE